MDMGKYKVIGLRVEKYLGQTCAGHNCDFEYGEEERDRHVILLKEEDTGDNYELTLRWEEDQCGSGWCTSTEAFMELKAVENFAGLNYKTKTSLVIDLNENSDYVHNDVFVFSEYGGDYYYPSGYYEVSMTLFEPSSD
uniref:Uncharacterized protein n=1 Tax=Vibrio phage P018-4 TaxID=3229728 RepID=A0AB39AJL6_9CAUD